MPRMFWVWISVVCGVSVALVASYYIYGSSRASPARAARAPLRFRDDGTFRIVQFADLHYGDPIGDSSTEALQRRIIRDEEPDLVVLSGDCVSGDSIIAPGQFGRDIFAAAWRRAVGPIGTI